MYRVRHKLLLATCLLALALACRQRRAVDGHRPAETTICAVAKAPTAFNQHVIKVRAQVMTDGIERTVLIDGNCPHVGVALGWGPTVSGASNLTDLLYGRGRSPNAEIEATFVGRFFADGGERRLEASQVMNVTVRAASGSGP
jgi:hypothetical protein